MTQNERERTHKRLLYVMAAEPMTMKDIARETEIPYECVRQFKRIQSLGPDYIDRLSAYLDQKMESLPQPDDLPSISLDGINDPLDLATARILNLARVLVGSLERDMKATILEDELASLTKNVIPLIRTSLDGQGT